MATVSTLPSETLIFAENWTFFPQNYSNSGGLYYKALCWKYKWSIKEQNEKIKLGRKFDLCLEKSTKFVSLFNNFKLKIRKKNVIQVLIEVLHSNTIHINASFNLNLFYKDFNKI